MLGVSVHVTRLDEVLASGVVGALVGAGMAGLAALLVGWRQRGSDRAVHAAIACGQLAAAVLALHLTTATFRAVYPRKSPRFRWQSPSTSRAWSFADEMSRSLERAASAYMELTIFADTQEMVDLGLAAMAVAEELGALANEDRVAPERWNALTDRMAVVIDGLKKEGRAALPRGVMWKRRQKLRLVPGS